jgi:hypothetical protein
MLRLNGGWKPGASNIYPYDGRHFRNGKKIWGDTFYAESRDRYLGLEGDGLRVVRPTVDELGRMQGQQGLFTWLDSEKYFELQGFCDNTGRGSLLTQFVLPGSAVLEGLRDLRAHGINARVLFPDLNGAAEHANTLWDIV